MHFTKLKWLKHSNPAYSICVLSMTVGPIVLWVSSLDRNVHRNRRNNSKSQGFVKVRDVVKVKDQPPDSFHSQESIKLRTKSNQRDTSRRRIEGASQNKDGKANWITSGSPSANRQDIKINVLPLFDKCIHQCISSRASELCPPFRSAAQQY